MPSDVYAYVYCGIRYVAIYLEMEMFTYMGMQHMDDTCPGGYISLSKPRANGILERCDDELQENAETRMETSTTTTSKSLYNQRIVRSRQNPLFKQTQEVTKLL